MECLNFISRNREYWVGHKDKAGKGIYQRVGSSIVYRFCMSC